MVGAGELFRHQSRILRKILDRKYENLSQAKRENMLNLFRPKKNETASFILIADGFDELEVVFILHKFRQAGLWIKTVSLFDPLVYSYQGVVLKADLSLADLPYDAIASSLLILPTSGINGETLRHDARIKTLLKQFGQGAGRVVVTDSQSSLALDINRLISKALYQPAGTQALPDFVDTLTTRLATS